MLDLSKLPADLGYDEDMAVDMIDIDFCLAARARAVKSLCITGITIRHGIGNRKEGSFIFSPTNYSSHRKYLQTRNRLAVWRKFLKAYPRFVFSDAAIWVLDSLRTIFLEPGRWSKTQAIVRGIADGLKLAKRQPAVARSVKG
jgi:rhamnosyltransferase